MATLDVKFYTAPIAGFSDTTTTPVATGWTQLAGAGAIGQSTTMCAVVENGHVRLIMDKNVAAGVAGSARILVYDSIAWRDALVSSSGGSSDFTIASVTKNDGELFQAMISWIGEDSTTMQGMVEIRRGLAAVGFRIDSGSSGDTDIEFRFSWQTGTKVRNGKFTALFTDASGVRVTDGYGLNTTLTVTPITDNFITIPKAGAYFDALFAYSTNEAFRIYRGSSTPGFDHQNLVAGDEPLWVWAAFMPRIYAMGDGGGADVGNGDGQVREGEDNFTSFAGTWGKDVTLAGASNSATVRKTVLALNDEVRWVVDVPMAGVVYIGAMVKADAGTPQVDLTVNGAATGSPKTVLTTDFDVQSDQLAWPVTFTAPGQYTLGIKCTTVSTATILGVDFISINPYEGTASTANTQAMPVQLANSILRQVTRA